MAKEVLVGRKGVKTAEFISRICWNSTGWIFPTGEAAKIESGTYVSKYGFGHEEWLFNLAWQLDGYHYAYLQPVGKSWKKVKGKSISIRLFTIDPIGQRFDVGTIEDCEILDAEQSKTAVDEYKKRGWFSQMVEQVKHISADWKLLQSTPDPVAILNLRFNPKSLHLNDPLLLVQDGDPILKIRRYSLVQYTKGATVTVNKSLPEGKLELKKKEKVERKGTSGTTVDPIHNHLQIHMSKLLKSTFGVNFVLEHRYIDLMIKRSDGNILVEIKSNPSAKKAIREALGQILEYAYFNLDKEEPVLSYVIAAPGELDEKVQSYIEWLRSAFKLPLRYFKLTLATESVEPDELL